MIFIINTKYSVITLGDNSITQMAMMDDDNISAAITHGGGGGITLHSRWKSQFDDSEGCSDNETEMYVECIPSRYSTAKWCYFPP